MSGSGLLAPLASALAAASLLLGAVTRPVLAEGAHAPAEPPRQAARESGASAVLRQALTREDQLAVLEAIHVGLSELADGATYVWHRRHGRLAGTVKPTLSFRDASGKVCRHVVFTLSLAEHSRSLEGIACRQPDKSWELAG